MSLYTTTLAKLNNLFKEPDGVMNGSLAINILTSAARQIVSGFQAATPTTNQVVLTFVAPFAMTFPAGLADSAANADTAANAETIFSIATDGGAAWGTITFDAAGTVGAFAAAALEEVAAGSVVTITGPASVDANIAGIAFALTGYA